MNRFLPMLLGISLVAAPGFVLAATAPAPAPVAPVVRTTTDVQPAKPVTAPAATTTAATTAVKKEVKPTTTTTTTTAAKPATDAVKKPNAG